MAPDNAAAASLTGSFAPGRRSFEALPVGIFLAFAAGAPPA